MKVVLVDGPAAGRLVDVDPRHGRVTVSLGSQLIRRVYGSVEVEVERHTGLATYRRDEATGEWRHTQTPLAIGDGSRVAAGQRVGGHLQNDSERGGVT